MDLNAMLYGLRHTKHQETVQKIETLCPADWGTERAFEACYRGNAQDAAARRSHICRIAGLAACLLFTVGLGANLWAGHRRIEPVPPQEPAPVVTEAATSAAEQETQQPETSQEVTEIETAAAESAAETQPETAAPTDAATEPPVTETPKPVQSEAAAEPVQPAETEAPEPAQSEPQTEQQTEPVPVPAAEHLNGFQVMQYPDHKQIVCTDAFPEPDGALVHYTVMGGMELLRAADTANAERTYEVADGDKVFTVTQREYAEFVMDVQEGDLIDIGLSRVHGFFLLQGDACTLYWFCDGEGFCVSGDLADLQSLLAIVRSFTPAEE